MLAIKGDSPGHEFRGNQYTGGGGGGSSSVSQVSGTSGKSDGEYIITKDGEVFSAANGHAGAIAYVTGEKGDDQELVDSFVQGGGVRVEYVNGATSLQTGRSDASTLRALQKMVDQGKLDLPDDRQVFWEGHTRQAWRGKASLFMAASKVIVTREGIMLKSVRMDWRMVLTAVKFLNRLGVKTLDYYAGALHGMVADLFDHDVTLDQFISLGNQLIEDQVTEAWFEGLGRNGFDVENMTSDWWDHLNGIIAREQDYFGGFADDIVELSEKEGSLQAALSRADLYAQRYIDIENQAWLYTAAAADTFVWALGATEEHCPECSALDGWVATAAEWQESGINPQMPPNDELTCGGWRCDCRLERTEAPSMGSPRDALEAIKQAHLKGDLPGHEFHGNQFTGGGGGGLRTIVANPRLLNKNVRATSSKFDISELTEDNADDMMMEAMAVQYPKGLPVYHESPGDVAESMVQHGIGATEEHQQDFEGAFATIGRPSGFVSGDVKTSVYAVIPTSRYADIHADMRYGGAYNLLKEHNGVVGADIYISGGVRPEWIALAEVQRGSSKSMKGG